jgi:beta-glucosidase
MEFFVGVEGTYAPQLDRDTLEVTGHRDRWRDDLILIKRLGVKEFRYPIPWHRIETVKGAYDWAFLDDFIPAAYEQGLEILADTLHHTSYPLWLDGGFLNVDFRGKYPDFVQAFSERYPQVRRYAPNNEPTCTLDFCGRRAFWHPYEASFGAYVAMLRNVARGTSEAIQRLTAGGKEIVHVDTAQKHHATDEISRRSTEFLNDLRFLFDELLLGRTLKSDMVEALLHHRFPAAELDWFRQNPATIHVRGLNYYPMCEEDRANNETSRAPSLHPDGFSNVALEYVERLGLPIMLSETNIQGTVRDRITWLKHMVEECERLEALLGSERMRGFTWFPAWDCMGWGMDCLLQEDECRKWHRDPQGIYWCDESWNRCASELSELYRVLAGGATSRLIPAYRLSVPVHALLGPLLRDRWCEWEEQAIARGHFELL